MELVEGPTLAEIIDRLKAHGSGLSLAAVQEPKAISQRALPLDDAVAFARQIAAALEAAHEQGIVHRDLKPENIKVRDDGTVKVLDFGLAKLSDVAVVRDASAAGISYTPTLTTPAMTGVGVILGTAAYMSPEQARGRVVDRRADIWAFGAVLYELLTGRRAFDGETVSDVLARVIEREPDWSALPASAPPSITRLLRRCLVKDPKARLQAIGEARIQLEALASGSAEETAVTPAPPAVSRRRLWTLGLAIGVAALALGVLGGWLMTKPAAREPQYLALHPPPEGDFGARADSFELSPDGRFVAYVARSDKTCVGCARERGRLWISELSSPKPRLVEDSRAHRRRSGRRTANGLRFSRDATARRISRG